MGSVLSANTDFDLQIQFLKRNFAFVGNPFWVFFMQKKYFFYWKKVSIVQFAGSR